MWCDPSDDWRSNGSREAIAARLAEEEEMAQRIEERVRERVAAALESEEVQKQIEARLKDERTALEQKVLINLARPILTESHSIPSHANLLSHA